MEDPKKPLTPEQRREADLKDLHRPPKLDFLKFTTLTPIPKPQQDAWVMLFAVWNEIFPQELCELVEPSRLEAGVLHVNIYSALVKAEFHYRFSALREALLPRWEQAGLTEVMTEYKLHEQKRPEPQGMGIAQGVAPDFYSKENTAQNLTCGVCSLKMSLSEYSVYGKCRFCRRDELTKR